MPAANAGQRRGAGACPPSRNLGNSAASATAPRTSSADAQPFLFNELFEVRIGSQARRWSRYKNAIPTIVIDDFLKHPEEARDVVGRAPAANWKHEKGGKNFVDYYDCRLRFPIRYPNSMIAAAQQVIRKVYTINTRPSDASVDVNWFKQIRDKRADFAVPHNDMTENVNRSFTCIVYLNRREECSGGTAFFRFKRSGSLVLDEPYARAIREDSRIAETGLDYWGGGAEQWWDTRRNGRHGAGAVADFSVRVLSCRLSPAELLLRVSAPDARVLDGLPDERRAHGRTAATVKPARRDRHAPLGHAAARRDPRPSSASSWGRIDRPIPSRSRSC